MKRLFSLFSAFVILLSFSACRRIGESEQTTEAGPTPLSAPETQTDAASSEQTERLYAPLPAAGIYNMTGYAAGVREDYTLITEYDDDLSAGVDLCVLSAFPGTQGSLTGASFTKVYASALEKSPEAAGLKQGFVVSYEANGALIENRILSPADIDAENLHYLEIYLYDDVNQEPGAWYSHLLEEQMTDETIITSVKLTPGNDFSAVRNIKLSVFLYSEEGQGEPYTVDIRPNEARYR